ncbi:hypothetical protein DLJ53_00705 [Acuticoccus sediminis]|uniref:Response regulatory domain-containing protein n=1 Tax=Acuticoccus sediminis TaxID=2184697 RepID=A0A8B2NWP4_9HYPH|nr:response regulator [Acuticoccus sediminis]RAI03090.1 hypothetical protein DLJ53_00705 [Acuticoccus sediminis]
MAPSRATANASQLIKVLLVEDADGDADLVRAYLEASPRDEFRVTRATNLTDALEHLRRTSFDAVVLDLTLPDAAGASGVYAVRDLSHAPIIVLTGADGDSMALDCLAAGAEDYLGKNELQARALTRAIGYAVVRRREQELRTMTEARSRFKAMTDATGQEGRPHLSPLRAREPEQFNTCVWRYYETLLSYTTAVNAKMRKPRQGMSEIAERLGKLNCATKDIVAVHAAALDLASGELPIERQCQIVVEGRLFALEMMGGVLEYYRSQAAIERGEVMR